MSDKATAQSGRLLWVEPNKMDSVTDTGTFDYEDYSICVDLEVRIPKRSACGTEDEVITFHTNHETAKDRTSFFTGTDGFLTTSFTDITANDPTSNKETLGISSIDITYNSYFYPQVTVKFVDVRGSSLMYPQEDMFKNGSQGSFFKALFCFPYPQFILKVKGFYGKQVQYDLAVEDFKTSFNPDTGNFECIVKFIGYMYGIYADLPMSYLIVAPYSHFKDIMSNVTISGRDYWKEQVEKGIFVFDDNRKPLETLVNLYINLTKIESEVKKREQTDPNVVEKNNLNTGLSHYEIVESNYSTFQRTIEQNKYKFVYGEKYIHVYTDDEGKINDLDVTILASWGILNNSIRNLNTYKSSLSYFGPNGKYSGITTNELKNQIVVKNVDFSWSTSRIYKGFSTINDAPEETLFKCTEQLPDDARNELLTLSVMTNGYYFFSFEHYNFISEIADAKKDINAKINEINKKINEKQTVYLTQTLGFTPNLRNIFKIIFAHLDTFMHVYYQVLDIIRQSYKNLNLTNSRSPKHLSLNADNSDLISEENFVPPYPLVVKEGGPNNKETIWPGNYNPAKDMIELKFVESLFNGIRSVESENRFQNAIQSNEGEEILPLYIPGRNATYNSNTNSKIPFVSNCISDFYYFNNPYTFFQNRDNINLYNLYTFLAYRLLDTSGLPSNFEATGKGGFEAINFYKAVPQLREDEYNQQVFIQFLKDKENLRQYAKDFIKFLKMSDNSLDKNFLNKLGNNNGVLFNSHAKPFLNNNSYEIPVNYNSIFDINFTNKSILFFPERKFLLTKTDVGKIGFFYDLWQRSINDELYRNSISNDEKEYLKSVFRNSFLVNPSNFDDSVEYETEIVNFIIKGSLLSHKDKITMNYWFANSSTKGAEWKTEWIKNMYCNETHGVSYTFGEKIARFENTSSFEDVQKALIHRDANGTAGYVIDPSYSLSSSIYGNELFYSQNSIEKEENRNLAKAYLFLEACAPLSDRSGLLDNIVFYPEWTLLLQGARSWRCSCEKEPLTTNGTTIKLGSHKDATMLVADSFKVENTSVQESLSGEGPAIVTDNSYYTNRYLYGTYNLGANEEYKSVNFLKNDYLVNEFKEWVNKEFIKINNALELKGKNNETFFPSDIRGLNLIVESFTQNSRKKKDEILLVIKNESCDVLRSLINKNVKTNNYITLSDLLKNILDSIICSNYSYIQNSTTDGGLWLGLNYKRDISRQLFIKKLENITVLSPVTTKVLTNEKTIEDIFEAFVTKLQSLYENNNGYQNTISNVTNSEESATNVMLRNDDLKLSLYLTLKNLYDRWLCGCGPEKWKMEYYVGNDVITEADANYENKVLCEYNKFYFIDSFYNDIGSDISLNLHTFKELINSVIRNRIGDDSTMTNGMKFQGMSVYQFMASVLQKNSMNFLAVPCFNTYKTEDSIRELFTPFSWFDRGEPRGTSYVGIYPHQVSSHLNIEGANGYQYPNDGVDIADVNGNFKDTLDIPDLADMNKGYIMPAFGVTYAKQDQSFFKKVTVNMDNPQVTEYSIGATLDIANNYGENQKVQTFVGQDLYKVYSNHSYTCTVEMMGNAMITPLMYFQLNNIPMFRGAYMIIKVEHNIVQGNMTTIFTGVRISKNKIPFVNPVLEGDIQNDTMNGTSGNEMDSLNNSHTTITEGTQHGNGTVDDFIATAQFAVAKGIKEEPDGSNKVPELPELPVQGLDKDYAWCAIFVGWCAEKSGLSPDIIGGPGWYKGKNWTHQYQTTCNGYYAYYNSINSIIQRTDENKVNNPPQRGDLILFKKSGEYESNNTYGHIGIVEGYNTENGIITYIHGNSGNKVKRTNKSYDAEDIGCFARPPYGCKVSNVKTTVQPTTSNAQTKTIADDDIIISSAEDKIRLINAMIWRECNHIDGQIGDDTTKYPAYGILQIRHYMLEDVTRIVKENPVLQGTKLGNLSSLTPETNIDKDLQVQELIAIFEWYNRGKSTYINDTSKTKDASQIPWSMKLCCAKWNGAVKGKPREPAAPKYFKAVKEKYNEYKTEPIPTGNLGNWTPDKAFNEFFN